MANYIYTRGYTVAELEALLVRVKAEREKYLQSASDSGSSYSRIAFSEIEKKFKQDILQEASVNRSMIMVNDENDKNQNMMHLIPVTESSVTTVCLSKYLYCSSKRSIKR